MKSNVHGSSWKSFAGGAALAAALAAGGLWWHSPTTAQVSSSPSKSAERAEGIEKANTLSAAFRSAAESILPTVVTIETRSAPQQVRGNRLPRGRNPFEGTPFEEFFKDDFNFDNQQQFAPRREGTGSGVIIDSSGIILTNNHVVESASEVLVRLSDGREYKAKDVKTDPQTDLAVVRIEGAGTLPAARLGDSDRLEIGDWVIAVGNPFGLESTVSAGIISGKGRELSAGNRTRFLQTDAAINPGNSGGPLVNLDGEVIGINTAIASNSGGYQGIGFAVPANLAKWVTSQLIDRGSVQRAYLGVGIGELTSDLAEQFGTALRGGVLVSEVYPNSPADKAGLQVGDVIVQFADHDVRSPRDLQELVERATLGTKQAVRILRGGRNQTLQVVPEALPADFDSTVERSVERREQPSQPEGEYNRELGMEVSEMSADQARALGFADYQGVVITSVDANGKAAERGLREGMLIREINKQPVTNLADFRKALKGASLDDGVLLLVRTTAGNRFVVLKNRD